MFLCKVSKILTYNITEIEAAARFVIAQTVASKHLCFDAQMGAGKTTLIKAICAVLGVVDVVSSPTFSIINTYATNQNETIFHLDLYRVADEEELIQAGVEDVLMSNKLCLIEWPKIAATMLLETALCVQINIVSEQIREVTVVKF